MRFRSFLSLLHHGEEVVQSDLQVLKLGGGVLTAWRRCSTSSLAMRPRRRRVLTCRQGAGTSARPVISTGTEDRRSLRAALVVGHHPNAAPRRCRQ